MGNTSRAESAAATVRALMATVPCGLDRAHDRVVRCESVAHLFPEAGDDEEAVVDRQPEPQGRGQVDREDRDVGDRAQHEQGQQCAEDRYGSHDEGQRGADHAAEHEDQQQQGERDGDHLRPPERRLDRRADLLVHRRRSSHGDLDDALLAPELVANLSQGLVGLLVLGRDAAKDQRLVTGLAAQRRWPAQGPVGADLGDVWDGGESFGDLNARLGGRRLVDVAG
jgi:hypothetical protein